MVMLMQPKQYVAGSQRDDGANSNDSALIAAGVGIGVLVLGLLALRGEKPASSGQLRARMHLEHSVSKSDGMCMIVLGANLGYICINNIIFQC